MHSDASTEKALLDIRDNILLAQVFVDGTTFEAFRSDRKTLYATIRALEIISEAARRLGPEVRARHPEQPWRSIMDAGNVYRHAYDNVAETAVWQTVRTRLASLLEVVAVELGRP